MLVPHPLIASYFTLGAEKRLRMPIFAVKQQCTASLMPHTSALTPAPLCSYNL